MFYELSISRKTTKYKSLKSLQTISNILQGSISMYGMANLNEYFWLACISP